MQKRESVSRDVVHRAGRRAPSYLVSRGRSWFFQIRVPDALSPRPNYPPLRVRLDVDSRQSAQRRAMCLAVHAGAMFEAAMAERAEAVSADFQHGIPFLAGVSVENFVSRLKTLEKRLRHPPSIDQLPVETLIGVKSLKDLIAIDREERDENGHPLVRQNADVLREQVYKRLDALTGAPASDDLGRIVERVAEIHEGQARILARLDRFGRPEPSTGEHHQTLNSPSGAGGLPVDEKTDPIPLFSEIATEYLEMREGAAMGGVGTARYRLNIFLDLVGDLPIDQYRPIHLQRYVNDLQYLPCAFGTDRPDARAMQGMTAREAVEANRDHRWEPLGIKTIKDGYVQVVKAATSHAASHRHIRHPFAGCQLRWPAKAKPSVQRSALDYETMNRVFKAGVAEGYLDDALLLPLSFLTSRRIGLLAYLRGSDFIDRHGVTTVQVSGILFDSAKGVWRRVPFKTEESLRFFVLHDLFRQIGFADWAKAQGDEFLFRALHRTQNPDAVASQRCNRLLDRAGARSRFVDVAHSFRHGAKDLMSEDLVDETASRIQMGHEISGVHSKYGRRPELRRTECQKLAEISLPREIDWSVFRGLDFEAMANKPRAKGRRRRT